MSPHTCQNDHHLKINKQQVLTWMQKKGTLDAFKNEKIIKFLGFKPAI